MNTDREYRQKNQPGTANEVKQVLDKMLERLGKGIDELIDNLNPKPQPVPVPVPERRSGKR